MPAPRTLPEHTRILARQAVKAEGLINTERAERALSRAALTVLLGLDPAGATEESPPEDQRGARSRYRAFSENETIRANAALLP